MVFFYNSLRRLRQANVERKQYISQVHTTSDGDELLGETAEKGPALQAAGVALKSGEQLFSGPSDEKPSEEVTIKTCRKKQPQED